MMQPTASTTKKPLMEDPQVLKLVQFGEITCRKWFPHISRNKLGVWISPTNTEVDGEQFWEAYARNLIKIGEYWIGRGLQFPQKQYADACFALTMKQMKGDREYLYVGERLNVEKTLLIPVLRILEKSCAVNSE